MPPWIESGGNRFPISMTPVFRRSAVALPVWPEPFLQDHTIAGDTAGIGFDGFQFLFVRTTSEIKAVFSNPANGSIWDTAPSIDGYDMSVAGAPSGFVVESESAKRIAAINEYLFDHQERQTPADLYEARWVNNGQTPNAVSGLADGVWGSTNGSGTLFSMSWGDNWNVGSNNVNFDVQIRDAVSSVLLASGNWSGTITR